MSSFVPRAIAMACLLSFSLSMSAHEPGPLNLRQALERTLATHPELAAHRHELRAREAEGRTQALGPAAAVELLVEDVGGSGMRSGIDAAQTTLSLSQILELGGKRSARTRSAEARASQFRNESDIRQLDLLADVARRFVETLSLQERVAAQREALDLARRVQAAVEDRVTAAASPEAERSRAAVATAEAELALEEAEHRLIAARQALIAATGTSELLFTTVAGDLYAIAPIPAFAALEKRLDQTPDLQLFAGQQRLREAELRLARAQSRPDLRATIGVRQFQDNDDAAFIGGIEMPLFGGSRAAGGIEAASARGERVASDRAAALLRLRTQLHAVHLEMEHASHVTRTLRETVVPQLAKALEQTEYAYRRGRYSYLEWSDAQRRQLEARNRYIDAATEYHLQKIEIERLTGLPFTAPGENS